MIKVQGLDGLRVEGFKGLSVLDGIDIKRLMTFLPWRGFETSLRGIAAS